MAAIELERLERRYGERVALGGVTRARGRGPDARGARRQRRRARPRCCGCSPALLRPHGGSARVLGAALPDERWKLPAQVGYLGHEPLLYRELSGRENLRYHARPARRAATRASTTLLADVGIDDRADEPVRELSRGPGPALRRSRAPCCTSPPLLLLDEPRANLDPAAAELRRAAHRPGVGAHARAREPRRRGRARRVRRRARAARRGAGPAPRSTRSCTGDPRRPHDPPQGPADRAAHQGVGAGDGAVLDHRLRAVPLRARPRLARRRRSRPGCCGSRCCSPRCIGVTRLFAAEREQGGIDGLLLAPVDRTALFVAKADGAVRLPHGWSSSWRCRPSALLLLGPGLGGGVPRAARGARARRTSASRRWARWWRRSRRRRAPAS